MDISVIICTYNRAESLRRTLQTSSDLAIPDGVEWELIVVDNNSIDGTSAVCEEFEENLPLLYLFEALQGKSHALNTAVGKAKGSLLAFTDDDVLLSRTWLKELLLAAATTPEASFFGGPIRPHWEAAPPKWLRKHVYSSLAGVAGVVNKGEEKRFLLLNESPFFGPNVMFRRTVFDEGFRFREDMCRRPGTWIGGEDTSLQLEILDVGKKGLYVPSAEVSHLFQKSRMNEAHIRRWFFGTAIKNLRLSHDYCRGHCFAGAPRYLWKLLVLNIAKYIISRPFNGSDVWLPAEICASIAWGEICEYRRLADRNNEVPPVFWTGS